MSVVNFAFKFPLKIHFEFHPTAVRRTKTAMKKHIVDKLCVCESIYCIQCDEERQREKGRQRERERVQAVFMSNCCMVILRMRTLREMLVFLFNYNQ